MIWRVVAMGAVIALFFAGWWIENTEQSGPVPAAAPVRNVASLGYAAQDAVLIETGPDGRPIYKLHASEIRQQPASNTVRLLNVTLRFRDPSGHIWNGRANEGLVSSAGASIELSGAVTLSGLTRQSGAPVSISSDRLAVNTRSKIVTTSDPVVLEWNGQRLSARGLVADLRDERVELKSDVHGLYHP